jgi:1-deoxy-D-xylulose-5-phosphate synthase
MRKAFREALDVGDAPTVVRYPKGAVGDDLPALRSVSGIDILAEHGDLAANPDVVVFGIGSMAQTAIDVAGKLGGDGRNVIAASATWVRPVPDGLATLVAGAQLVVTIEDGLRDGGVGEEWADAVRDEGVNVQWSYHGVPKKFLDHATRAQIVEAVGLDASAIADNVKATLER